jgi:N-methylhydantoinase B
MYKNDGDVLQAKRVLWFEPNDHVHLNLPGGGGYGDPFLRDPQLVLADVVNGYVSISAALRDYGVAIRYIGAPDQIVRLPEHYALDETTTRLARVKTNTP